MQEANVVQCERREHDDGRWLDELATVGIGIFDCRNAPVLFPDAPNPALLAKLEVWPTLQDRQQGIRWLRFRTDHATVPGAIAAVGADWTGDAIGILVRLGEKR